MIEERLAQELSLLPKHVNAVVALIDEGNTIPFIARYRKEMHGSMDDQLLRTLADRLQALRNLEKRREEVRASITEQGKMTDEIAAALDAAQTITEIEDIYRPFKPKRRTRATIARERGLEPLSDILAAQELQEGDPLEIAAPYVNEELGVPTAQDALNGACDILAEIISDHAELRKTLRALLWKEGSLNAAATTEEDTVYRLYYDFSEPLKKCQPHRILAINRGESEGILKVALTVVEGLCVRVIEDLFIEGYSIFESLIQATCQDAWKRLIFPSIEREVRGELTDIASEQAIKMFSLNLKPLLMQPPVRGKVAMGFDPAYRTGCKIAVVDGTGKLLDTAVVYPTPPTSKIAEAKTVLKALIKKHGIEIIAIGNGTASKESEIFVAEMLREITQKVSYMVVNEAGASVYSASKLGADEFPDKDVSLRSAVSIARRLQDPLAELVKIDPKSIGVGQYQHDMPAARLTESLDGVVEDCVNAVGVDLNTASAPLLTRVSGVGPSLAKNIVTYREANGLFKTRRDLKKVPKLGPRAYEQCAGFLRVPDSKQILDNTAVHPESYEAAEKLLELCDYTLVDVRDGKIGDLNARVSALGEASLAEACGVGAPTLRDIVRELQKPGRDPRDELPPPMLRTDVMDMNDLQPGMTLQGTVRNVIDFGVFVDIGVHQDGLVHISELTDRFIRHPSEVVRVGDVVNVTVLAVDAPKKRISLSMKSKPKVQN